ncbi:LLM class flavin-dependent oxidoreductase [Streptomyces sp. NPDC007157]|uniref:LLM class flavin-dependent oxidoreductase n=1 Tax=Streptomyces sp. NPDC007157 TaxID=3154681 RepID=UPI0033CA70B3
MDHLAVQDHPYQPDHLDAWTLISHLSALTERIVFVTDVADLQLRPPVMLAKAAASLSVLTGGRVRLGVGGGGIPDAIASMGGPARRGPDMVAFAEESVELLHRALNGEVVRHHSPYHSIGGYQPGPNPPQPVGVWLGAQKRRMLTVTGRYADGWISPSTSMSRHTRCPPGRRSSTRRPPRPAVTPARCGASTT